MVFFLCPASRPAGEGQASGCRRKRRHGGCFGPSLLTSAATGGAGGRPGYDECAAGPRGAGKSARDSGVCRKRKFTGVGPFFDVQSVQRSGHFGGGKDVRQGKGGSAVFLSVGTWQGRPLPSGDAGNLDDEVARLTRGRSLPSGDAGPAGLGKNVQRPGKRAVVLPRRKIF